ncbi:MAG: 2-succinyl-5-enolpyruvyl-6-hydroxy-3-cyclohexene-1-carboxylic-acid synthase, partial [Acidobacteriota bacterium]|nr:2-succinyl-5-enolpyruvyl-6-hydroxy-3-cyclohexene-1-carboxylic-acid synthase [Acidobacteriota bacterium]
MTADSSSAPPQGPSNLLTEWARLLLDSFAAAGVRQVVISPGSRSTPFVAAAAAHPGLQCHDVVDERSAAFFALGQAKVSGRPSLLLCTSGSAGAHYLPAVLEARQSQTPMLLLTADRPFELMDCTAPQTVDQTRFLGHHSAAFVELGEPSAAPMALRALRRKAVQAVWRSRHPEPGAVHLNARARKPLEPEPAGADASPAAEDLRVAVDELLQQPAPQPMAASAELFPEDLAPLAEACRQARRGLILCGPAPLQESAAREAVYRLAAATGFPILVEAASQLRFAPGLPESAIGAFDLLFGSPAVLAGPAPDLILQLGAPPVSGTWGRYLAANPEIPHAVLAPYGWNDAINTARWLVFAPVATACGALTAALTPKAEESSKPLRSERQAWLQRFQGAETAAWSAAEAILSQQETLSEGATARRLVEALPEGALLSLGNSLPIRQVDRWVPPSPKPLRILSQRGTSGIDGLISSAAGAATVLPP